MAVGQEHGFGEEAAILGHADAHGDDGLGDVNDFVHAQGNLSELDLPLQLFVALQCHEADAYVRLDSARIEVEHRSHVQCAL